MSNQKTINDVKTFWDSRPCNIRHSSEQVGTRKYFDEVEARKYFVEPHIPKFADFSAWTGKRVLEIGCGIGTDAVNFVRNGAVYTGVELSRESLEIAKKRFEVFNLEGSFLEGNAEIIDQLFVGKSFDLIYSFGVLHHTPNISRALNAISRISNEETILKMMLYAKHSWKNALIMEGLDQPEAQYGCPIANVYSREEVTELLNNSGFAVQHIHQDHIFPYIVDKYKNYEYVEEDWFKVMTPQVRKALESQLGWHLLIQAKKVDQEKLN